MTGVARGLQSRRWVDKVQGGFDSHSPPPFLRMQVLYLKIHVGQQETRRRLCLMAYRHEGATDAPSLVLLIQTFRRA